MNFLLLFLKFTLIISNYGLAQEEEWEILYPLKSLQSYEYIYMPENELPDILILGRGDGADREYRFDGASDIDDTFSCVSVNKSGSLLLYTLVRIEVRISPGIRYYYLCEFYDRKQAESFFTDLWPNLLSWGEPLFNVGKVTEYLIAEDNQLIGEKVLVQQSTIYKRPDSSFYLRSNGETIMFFPTNSFDIAVNKRTVDFSFDGINHKIYGMECKTEDSAESIDQMMSYHANSE